MTPEELSSHHEASEALHAIKDEAFSHIRRKLVAGEPINELDAQTFIIERMEERGLTSDGDKPIVAVNEHAATPHYFPSEESNSPIREGDLILIDLWARKPKGVYADITWMAYAGKEVPHKHAERFALIVKAREAALGYLQESIAKGYHPKGMEVDEAARSIIRDAGLAQTFIHNLGHSIDTRVHGSGVNLRGYTEKEERAVHEGLLFSVEPGIYLEGEAGYRTEIDARIEDGKVIVTGPKQERITPLLDSNL